MGFSYGIWVIVLCVNRPGLFPENSSYVKHPIGTLLENNCNQNTHLDPTHPVHIEEICELTNSKDLYWLPTKKLSKHVEGMKLPINRRRHEQEVFKCLPTVVLNYRIRTVCKQWKDLVDSLGFVKFYSAYHSKSKHLLPPRVLGITRNGEEIYSCNPFVAGSEAHKDWVRQDVYSHIWVFKRGFKHILLRLHSALVLEPSMQRYWICIAEERLHVYDSRSGVWDQVDYLAHLIQQSLVLSFNMEEMRWSIEWSSSNPHMGAGLANWVVTTAPQFFIVAIVADRGVVKMMLIRLDCASKRFVKEASFPYNQEHFLVSTRAPS
ncbi:hypothetical protein SELMODRAFT_423532 [Selaginella moellendorffii]|uniref:F-box domain-containing protein n=1 Tax=Selaginella moellendorffii TaxID=88036 RepID=D8SM04_SELML|nr:hypothetical protein SELMODRAFT_423532 [Selaginella moellendorffii]